MFHVKHCGCRVITTPFCNIAQNKVVNLYILYIALHPIMLYYNIIKGTQKGNKNMKYAIYFEYSNGTKDSCNVRNAKDRDLCIKTMKDFYNAYDNYTGIKITSIMYCRIYKSGEYGKRKAV